jgi:hypothetical protein
MDFTIMCTLEEPSMFDGPHEMVAFQLPFVLVGLLLWRRRGARDPRDVLGAARGGAVSAARRRLETWGPWAMIGLALLPVAWVTVRLLSFLFFGEFCGSCAWAFLPDVFWRQSAVAMGLCVGGLVYWLRAADPERDVLGLTARS